MLVQGMSWEYSRYSSSVSGHVKIPSCCIPRRQVPHFLYSSYAYPSFICSRSPQKDSILCVSMLATFQSFLYRQSSQSKKMTAGLKSGSMDDEEDARVGDDAVRMGAREEAARAVDATIDGRERGSARVTTPRIIHRRATDSVERRRRRFPLNLGTTSMLCSAEH